MTEIALSDRQQRALRSLLAAEAVPGTPLPDRHVLGQVVTLVPCDSIGVTLARLHRYDEARTALEEALVVNRQTHERLLEAHTLASLGDVAQSLGRPDAAAESFEAALALRRELQDRRGEGWMLHHLARAEEHLGHTAAAGTAAAEAARIALECDDAELRRACGLGDAMSPASVLTEEE